MIRLIIIFCLSLACGRAAESQSSLTRIQVTATVQNVTPLGDFSGTVIPVDAHPRYALSLQIESVTGATNFAAGQIVTFAVHSPSKLFSGKPTKGKTYQMELDRKFQHGTVMFSDLRLRTANHTSAAPGLRLAESRVSEARPGSALR